MLLFAKITLVMAIHQNVHNKFTKFNLDKFEKHKSV